MCNELLENRCTRALSAFPKIVFMHAIVCALLYALQARTVVGKISNDDTVTCYFQPFLYLVVRHRLENISETHKPVVQPIPGGYCVINSRLYSNSYDLQRSWIIFYKMYDVPLNNSNIIGRANIESPFHLALRTWG